MSETDNSKNSDSRTGSEAGGRQEQQKQYERARIKAGVYLTELLRRQGRFAEIAQAVQKRKLVKCTGLASPARPLLISALNSGLNEKPPILWITPSADSAERLLQDAQIFLSDNPPLYFPENERASLLDEEQVFSDPDRLAVLQALDSYKPGVGQLVIIAPLTAVLQPTVRAEKLEKEKIIIKSGESLDAGLLNELLAAEGYRRTAMVEGRGEYSVRGGIIDIYPITGAPVRMELFGDEVESMRLLNIETQRSHEELPEITLLPARETQSPEDRHNLITDYLKDKFPDTLAVLDEPAQLKLTAQEWLQDFTEADGVERLSGDELYIESADNPSWEQVEALLSPFRQLTVSAWSSDELTKREDCFELAMETAIPFNEKVEGLIKALPQWHKEGRRTVVLTSQYLRLRELLKENSVFCFTTQADSVLKAGQILVLQGFANEGWRVKLNDGWLEVLSDREIMGQRLRRRKGKSAERNGSALRLDELSPGDLVVHLQHGIGRYAGVQNVTIDKISCDMIKLEYAKGDSLLIPVDQLDLIQKYEGLEDKQPVLSRLGTGEWKRTKAKIRERVKIAAEELVKIYAARAEAKGYAYPPDNEWQHELEDAFPYQETPDQLRAIREVKADLESHRPMDRLICGDVGYGKTEVAIRAVFKVVNSGRQAAILAPTTILAQQHYLNFCERFAPYPVKVELLSRFRSAKEQKQTFQHLASGECDVVIGTHRLLAKDLEFKNLGLLIIDEEHRFGVMHKNKLKKLKADIDVMTMSATPIPRTLQMSFYGIREMSLIETPPEERLPVKTYLFERRSDIIKAAVSRELNRQGQVYFLHNRVETIERTAADLQRLLPKARIAVGHGQMNERRLEDIMTDFYEGHYDILVCSTIIESGLDVPNVNTIIIDNAHCMGLAQLYQLRGRVGRSAKQGYCYLLCPPARQLTPEAQKRLKTIREFTHLGAGYQIAKRDLEIRGAGNMLGAEQSGHVTAVGFSLYCKMLEDAIRELRREQSPLSESKAGKQTIILELPISAHLPDSYVPDSQQKVALYKRLALINDSDSLEDFREELLDRYGKLPQTASNLLDTVRLKIECTRALVPTLRIKGDNLWVVAPFLRPLAQKELYGLTKLTGWPVRQDNSALCFRNLFGNAIGSLDYPPDPVLIEQLFKILRYIKELPPQAPPEPVLSTAPRRLTSYPCRRSRFGGFR